LRPFRSGSSCRSWRVPEAIELPTSTVLVAFMAAPKRIPVEVAPVAIAVTLRIFGAALPPGLTVAVTALAPFPEATHRLSRKVKEPQTWHAAVFPVELT